MKIRIILFLLAGLFIVGSCLKETYDMDTFSDQAELSPSVVLKIARGTLNLADAIEPSDTIVFHPDKTISIVYRKDSVIGYDVNELLDIPSVLPEDGPKTENFVLGNLLLGGFSDTESLSLQAISDNFPEPTRSAIQGLFGSTAPFPPINPPVSGGSHNLDPFPNFTIVTIDSGKVSLGLTNNLPVPVSVITIRIYDSNNNTAGTATFNNVAANGGSASQVIDLAGKTLTNSFFVEITALGTPGSATPVAISGSDDITVNVSSNGLRLSSGTAILPDQLFTRDSTNIDLDLSGGEKVYEIKLKTASISYRVISTIREDVKVIIDLPATKINGNPVRFERVISYNGGNPVTGTFSLNNSITNLKTDPLQPYNIIPFKYELSIQTTNNQVTFTSGDVLDLEVEVTGIQFEYAKGHLGSRVETMDEDTIDLADEFLDKISGSLNLTDPKVKFIYRNSFGVPITLDLDVTGKFRDGSTAGLNALPTVIKHPADTINLVVEDSVTFNKSNSDIENLLVFPLPREISYSGAANINTSGSPTDTNFVTHRSRFDADLEVEIPLDFSSSGLVLLDTLEVDISAEDFDPEDLEFIKIYVNAQNWFPFDLLIQLTPFDSVANTTLGQPLEFTPFAAAEVNAQGIVEQPRRSNEEIDISSEYYQNLTDASHVIVRIRLETSGGGSRPVKILSTYSIDFQVGIRAKFAYPLNGTE